ncbi:MAG: transcriptional regulator [Archangiaceae bacterium]|nr:transcriptional regulator [Archangiaceae bacterium]
MGAPGLAQTLIQSLAAPAADVELDALQAQLEAVVKECREVWPALAVPEEAFLRHLAERLDVGGELVERLVAVHASDLYLACACALGLPAALAELERQLASEARRAIARVDGAAHFVDEVHQRLRQKLLLEGKIAEYRGRGSLVHWLRATAVRDALKLKRSEKQHEPLNEALELERASVEDVELEIIRGRHASDFSAAFEASFAALSARERNLLRMHVLDALTIDQIGAFYRTHRTTAFRWLEAARHELARNIRRELQARLKLGGAELDSLMGVLRSRLDLSIRRVLAITAQ